jgi:outer membrane lipoprotein-sorting protein
MKKLFLAVSFLLAVAALNAQSLEDIINNYTVANKLDKISNFKTIHVSAKMSMMGMDMPMEMWMKNPNKIKIVTSMNGQDMVQAFDGEKGYTISPMTGSTAPVEMTAEQLKNATMSNMFNNYMAQYLKDGKLSLEGEDNVNGKPAFKIKASLDGGNSATMFIDKSTYLILKTVTDVNQGGMTMAMESFPSDYTETNGILLPMKTTMSASGMEIVTTFTKVEVDIPIEDSVFKIK